MREKRRLVSALNKLKVEETMNGEYADAHIKGHITSDELMYLCNGIAELEPTQQDSFWFWFRELTTHDVWKLYTALECVQKSPQVDNLVKTACQLSLEVLHRTIDVPCEVSQKAEEVGHLEAVDDKLDFYLTQAELEEAHTRGHEIIDMIVNSEDAGGFVHRVHLN